MENSNMEGYKVDVSRHKNIDYTIEQSINEEINKLIKQFKLEPLEGVSEQEKIKITQNLNVMKEKISLIFEHDFSEMEQKIREKVKYNKILKKEVTIEEMILKRRLDKRLEGLLNDVDLKYDREFLSYVEDRKIFLMDMLEKGILRNEKIEKLIGYTKEEKEEERDK